MLGLDQDTDRQAKRLVNLGRNAREIATILSDRIALKEGRGSYPAIWLDQGRLDRAFAMYLARLPAYRAWVGSGSLANAAKIAALTILCVLEHKPLQYGHPGAARTERAFSNSYLCYHIACNFMRVPMDSPHERLRYGFMRSLILLREYPEKSMADPTSADAFSRRVTLIVHLIELLFRKSGDVLPME